jgi:hypothetical protein
MITIEIMGGLGNQLFQVFALISYALINKQPFFFENKVSERVDRPLYWDNFLSNLKPFVRHENAIALPVYREPKFDYTEITPFDRINGPFKMLGYFQSYKYFEENQSDILRLIKFDKQQEETHLKHSNLSLENTISLHFRIGDYKLLQDCHPLVGVEYYKKCLHNIIENTGKNDWNVLYFYEEMDNDMVEANIKEIKKEFGSLQFVPIDIKLADYTQMILMSLCQHNIIANSSFSWWGAHLNKNEEKIVCYPNPENWFGPGIGKKNMTTMFPNGWHKVI